MDFYLILGVPRAATPGEIKRAYRRLARRYHPDINPGDREAALRFRQILDAYETLIDPDRRRRYDTGHGEPGPAASSVPSFGFAGFDFSPGVHAERTTTFGELFEEVFQRREAPRDDRRGADIHARTVLDFDQAWRGVDHVVTVTRHVPCQTCVGSGFHRTAESRCVACEGTGTVRSVRGHMVFAKNCPRCGGSGRQRQVACESCHGQGVEARTETLTVRVPAGVADGARIRIAQKGHAGVRGGAPGDLYLDVEVRPHPLFRREGDDLHLTVPIAVHEAALGARVEIPTPDGPARLRVVPGTQSGQRFRLRERGMPSPRTGRRGDLIAEVRLMLPAVLDERSKELLREFGRINGESVRAFPARVAD
ncbi:MAG: molecular chaperone DnaJ [Vicinamibacterales bacterium]